MPDAPDYSNSNTSPEEKRNLVANPDYGAPPRQISELVAHPDFPKSALGEHVDVGGYTGVAVELVGHSLKVKSREGITRSFNVPRLRRIYGPPPEPAPFPERVTAPEPPPFSPAPPSEPKREVIAEPDFSKPVRPIQEFVKRNDYPKCVFGEHVEIGGYTGVVVEIVNRSLKVRSPQGTSRNYNADVLRKLHGGTV